MAAKSLKEIINERNFRTAAEKMAFAFGWNAATENAEALKPSHNKQSTPPEMCEVCKVKEVVYHVCNDCYMAT